MIEYIHQLCREWGDARFHIDHEINTTSSIWGRFKGGWSIASADCFARPDPPEVMLGGALAISIAIHTAINVRQLTERQFQVLYAHYAERGATKRKIFQLKLSKRRYYDILDRCHRVLSRNLPSDEASEIGVDDKINGTESEDCAIPTREARCA